MDDGRERRRSRRGGRGARIGTPPAALDHAAARQAVDRAWIPSWGIRFTVVQLLADNGLVELRYQVLDNNKANRLHSDNTSLTNLPTIYVEGIDKTVKSNSLLFHIHHEWESGSDGRSYSIVYGNAGGVIYPRALVTISLPDGLKLQHVPVSG